MNQNEWSRERPESGYVWIRKGPGNPALVQIVNGGFRTFDNDYFSWSWLERTWPNREFLKVDEP